MSTELVIQVIAIGLSIIAGYFALAKLVVHQFNAGLDARFAALETARKEGQQQWYTRLEKQEAKLEALDGDVRRILIELPREYVTRTDYVRRETIIEGKIDQLSLRIENWMIKGGKDAG